MDTLDREPGFAQGRFAELEQALMEEFLQLPLSALNSMQPAEARKQRIAASLYASLRMEEMKARAHLVVALHGGSGHLDGIAVSG